MNNDNVAEWLKRGGGDHESPPPTLGELASGKVVSRSDLSQFLRGVA